MQLDHIIEDNAAQPLTHQWLLSLLKDYKRPDDKLQAMVQDGLLEPVKKGFYIAGPAIRGNKPEPFLLANHLLGPSYVSSDAALYYYDLIPEKVFEISSMTTKASRSFMTSAGLFSYTRLPLPYYAFDIRQVVLSDTQITLMASPEKALFDKIVTTSGLVFRSRKGTVAYLLENLRMDETQLKAMSTSTMQDWLTDAPKQSSLHMLIRTIESL